MADVNRGNRPLSPHLSIYRPQLNSMTSILVRITGNAMIVAAFLLVWWLIAAATGADYFATVDGIVTSFLGDLVMALSVLGLWYHALGGGAAPDLGRRLRARPGKLRPHGLGHADRVGRADLPDADRDLTEDMMAFVTDRKRVTGLGAAKSGTHHFWTMTVTSVALLVLTPFFPGDHRAASGRLPRGG